MFLMLLIVVAVVVIIILKATGLGGKALAQIPVPTFTNVRTLLNSTLRGKLEERERGLGKAARPFPRPFLAIFTLSGQGSGYGLNQPTSFLVWLS
jgi:hypothetical protein